MMHSIRSTGPVNGRFIAHPKQGAKFDPRVMDLDNRLEACPDRFSLQQHRGHQKLVRRTQARSCPAQQMPALAWLKPRLARLARSRLGGVYRPAPAVALDHHYPRLLGLQALSVGLRRLQAAER